MAGQYLVNCKVTFRFCLLCVSLSRAGVWSFVGEALWCYPIQPSLTWIGGNEKLFLQRKTMAKTAFPQSRQFTRLTARYTTKNQISFKKESIFHSDTRNVGIPAHWITTLKRYFFYEYPPHPRKSRNNQLSVTIQSSVQCIWHREFGRTYPVFFNRAWCLSNPVVFAFIGVVCFTYPCWNAKNWWLRWAKHYLTAQSCKSLRYCSAGFSENLANSDPTPRCGSFAIWDEPRVPALQGEIFFMYFRWTSENWLPYP